VPRFVLLEHHWNGIHWDFMLETVDGSALRTWAVDAPIVPGRDLPARALGDHRLAYLDFEGEVSGGRGTVRRVDSGTYEAEVWEPDRVRVRLQGAQLVGALELREAVSASGEGIPGALSWKLRLGNFD
jgi:DNA polymerase ligase (LigD)-like protein